MKKTLFLAVAAVTALFSACSSDELANSTSDSNVVNVSFSANFDQVMPTRSVSGDTDGTQATTLYVAVYNANKELIKAISNIGVTGSQPTVTVSGKQATVNFQLVKGQTYSFAFWAQNPSATALAFDAVNKKVTINYGKANDETLDAFTAHVNDLTVTGAIQQSVTLKRPWAQVNFGATQDDVKAAHLAGIDIKKTKVTVNNVFNTLNLLDGTVADPQTADFELALNAIPSGQHQFDVDVDGTNTQNYGKLTVNATDYAYMGLNYLLVGGENDTQSLIKADLSLYKEGDDTNPVNKLAFSNVPVQRNYRTNIVGNLLTSQVQFNVTIDGNYDNESNIEIVTTVDSRGNQITESKTEDGKVVAVDAEVKTEDVLADVLKNSSEDLENISVTLQEDNMEIDFGARNNWGGENTENIVIDGNGKTVVLGGTDSDWSSIGSKNGTVTIKNATVVFKRVNGGNNSWNNHALNFTGKVIAENVTFTNSVSVGGDAAFTNCSFTEAGAFYTLIIKANVNNVAVKGCTFEATNGGRGIKFMDQYIDESEQVQGSLTISDCTFKTAKKAAILVTNTKGAKITARNLNITEVTEDNVNAVWNDEDRVDAYDLVVVEGCTKKQEGQ